MFTGAFQHEGRTPCSAMLTVDKNSFSSNLIENLQGDRKVTRLRFPELKYRILPIKGASPNKGAPLFGGAQCYHKWPK